MNVSELFADPSIRWHQRFLVEGHQTPGTNDMSWLMAHADFPASMAGMSVIDIGTTNGAVAFEAEHRGASRVVAVDICPPAVFGFTKIAGCIGSAAEYVEASIYELPELLEGETFDYVVFWGVLYHLRHPLLGLDALAQLARGLVTVETVVAPGAESEMRFFRGSELNDDGSNWWAPTEPCLRAMLGSAGLEASDSYCWGEGLGSRAIVNCVKAGPVPEYLQTGYDREISGVHFSDRRPDRTA
jgi:hypothetical protein